MRDVVKTNVKREQSRKRKRRRKSHTMLYFFLVVLIVTGIGILLSVTLFFNVKKINVNGSVDYTKESIIMTSGIKDGDNLIRLDSEKVSETILSSMIYIETAEVDKQYPGTVVINVTGCIPTANVESKNGFVLVSEKGKILENDKDKTAGVPVIKGIELSTEELGKYIDSAESQKVEIITELLKACRKYENSKISEIDLSDIYDIKVIFDDRITFKMGNSNDVIYKINLASTVLEKIDKKKYGIMAMIGSNQISFRENKDGRVSSSEPEIPVSPENKITIPTEASDESSYEDENGDNYIYNAGGSSDDESYDDGYTDDGYSDDGYTDDGYTNDGYTDEGYADDGYGGDEYAGDEETYYEQFYSSFNKIGIFRTKMS